MINNKFDLTQEDNKMLRSTFWRTLSLSSSYNYERMQALGYIYAMIPAIRRFHKDAEARRAAYKRHFEIFNTTPTTAGFITGLTSAMEKEAAEDPDFDTSSINAVKVSLMGPFAGIGDSIFWGSLRIISLGVGVSLASQGNILGVILHLLLFNLPAHFIRYYGVFYGYGLGSGFIKKATESGLMGFITKAAGTVGLMTVGAMSCSMVKFNIPMVLNIQGSELAIQGIFDQIFPNILPLCLVFICYRLLNKGAKPIVLMLVLMVIGIIGKLIGLF